MDYDFLKKTDDKWGIAKLQNKILEVALFVHKACMKQNAEYFLMGGSALGAIRHNGFIPWDDDLDIFMTPQNYAKFKKIFDNKNNAGKYHLQEYGKCGDMVTLAKVRDSNTTLIESGMEKWDINHGIYIDIFILHVAGFTSKQIKKQAFWSRYLVIRGLSIRGYKGKTFFIKLLLLLCKFLPKKFLLGFALKRIYKYDSIQNPLNYCHFLGRAGIKKGVYSANSFQTAVLHDFEKTQLLVPCNLKQYVVERWGRNYMEPPNINEIKAMQHPSFWDVNLPFKNYLKDASPKKTENKLII